jgi:Ca-activated chloride channel family protein
MIFQWPLLLWLLLLVPALVLTYIIAQRRRQKFVIRYSSLSIVKQALARGPGLRRHVPPAFFIVGFAFMLIALARPTAVVALPSQEGTIILTIDVSGSMQADDLKPSRMDAAKEAAAAFVENQPAGVKIGIVTFSDNANIVQAPTADKQALLAAIDRLEPVRGTAIGRGLITSLDAIDPLTAVGGASSSSTGAAPTPVPEGHYEPAIIILLTDGENNMFPPPLSVIDRVAERGIRVYTVGIGTAAGVILHIQGRSIPTRLDEDTLKQIADLTKGQYYNATSASDLRAIYEKLATHMVIRSDEQEITFGFAGLAGLMLVCGGILSLLWFNRLP